VQYGGKQNTSCFGILIGKIEACKQGEDDRDPTEIDDVCEAESDPAGDDQHHLLFEQIPVPVKKKGSVNNLLSYAEKSG